MYVLQNLAQYYLVYIESTWVSVELSERCKVLNLFLMIMMIVIIVNIYYALGVCQGHTA